MMPIEQLRDRMAMSEAPSRPVKVLPPRKRRNWLWLVAVVGLGVAGFVAYRRLPALRNSMGTSNKPPRAPAPRGVPVITASARRGDLPIFLDGLGTVTAFNTVTVRARVDGQVVKVGFVEGQLVKAGDVLAEIDARPFQADLDSKLAAEGQAAAQLDLANVTYTRLKGLLPERLASPIEFQTAEATYRQAQAALAAAKANVESSRLNVEWCRITAPISGRIGLRLVDSGNLVHASDPNGIAVIMQLQPIAVIFNLPQDALPEVLKANSTEHPLEARAYSSDLRTLLATGALVAVDNQIDTGTGTARLKAVFENRDDLLFPNQFVNVRLLVDTKKDVVLVPTAAVQRSPQTVFVYVVKADLTAEMRPITPGPTEHGSTMVEKGLEPGEIVVTDGVDKLQPGSLVIPSPADAPTSRAAS